MLFRPSADQNLEAVHVMLDGWNTEADRLRKAAMAVRDGTDPGALTAAAAEEAHDGLMSLLSEIDEALDTIPAGSPLFGRLLKAQVTTVALLDSVGNSFDILERFRTGEAAGPTKIAHAAFASAK